jgi:hypothetical protein
MVQPTPANKLIVGIYLESVMRQVEEDVEKDCNFEVLQSATC